MLLPLDDEWVEIDAKQYLWEASISLLEVSVLIAVRSFRVFMVLGAFWA
jgi:hypothetical protein